MISFPQCNLCQHLHENDLPTSTCDAFPHGIPEDILLNKIDHKKPYPGDNGIVFQLNSKKQEKMLAK